MSIKGQKAKDADSHCEKLEHLYLAAPSSEYSDPGVRISQREAEVLIPVQDKFINPTGFVHDSLCFTAMSDAATLAVNSVVGDVLVVMVNFNIFLSNPIAKGELVARARLLGNSGDQYLAESVLRDCEGNELGRGNGTFTRSSSQLSEMPGYA